MVVASTFFQIIPQDWFWSRDKGQDRGGD